ncbi:MAG: chorismate-binding protein [Kiritimatiellia bacterium]
MKYPANNEVLLRDVGGGWLHFRSPHKVLCAHTLEDVRRVLAEASCWEGWAAGYVGYEAAPAFDSAFPTKKSGMPLAWFALYDAPEKCNLPEKISAGNARWSFDTDKNTYVSQIKEIKNYIREGETYQVNHTVRLRTKISDAWSFFLENMSGAEFSTYIQRDELAICSASPELFFEINEGAITCCPMKGTGTDADTLAKSAKDRAENIMIVDMIRNDLGRICAPGTIAADPLFDVQPFGRIWQMTSTVKGESSATVPEIFTALFPCASITGAPKRRTMQIIQELESTPRGVYCGAIGYIAPGRKARFSVAIRTVEVDRKTKDAVYGVGGGIIWDSQPEAEWNECALKTEILGGARQASRRGHADLSNDFQLLETMLYDNGIAYLEEHLQRLTDSAAKLRFKLDAIELRQKISSISGASQRIRLLLSRDGVITLESFPFAVQKEPPRRVALSRELVDPKNTLLYHKTTRREIYNNAKEPFPDADDVILCNIRSEITESTTANVVARIDGKLVTPPLSCGLLPGTMRTALLKQGEISERVISCNDLQSADEIFLINSLRGWMPASLLLT